MGLILRRSSIDHAAVACGMHGRMRTYPMSGADGAPRTASSMPFDLASADRTDDARLTPLTLGALPLATLVCGTCVFGLMRVLVG